MTATAEPFSLHVRNSLDGISEAIDAAEAWVAGQAISREISFFVGLVIEELVSNCIKYGYDDSGEHFVDVTLSVADHTLTMLVVDDGRRFNVLDAPAPDLSLPIEERPVGGLGIHMLRKLADHIEYERRDGTNRLTLTKRAP